MPATVQPHAFTGEPPFVPAHDSALEIRDHGDEDVDGHDDEREGLEPMFGADAPFVLDHHEADTAGKGGVQLGIMEPAVHVQVSLIFEGPGCSGAGTDGDGYEIAGEQDGNDEESDDAAQFGTAGELIEEDEACEYDKQHSPLSQGVSPIDLEKHR